MKRTILIITLFLIFCYYEISAQVKKWTLEDCVTYAVANNIGLQRQKLQTEVAEVNLLKSKMDILPSLNFESDGSVQYGRSIDPITNGVIFQQNFRNGYSLYSNIRLFNGFTTLNTITANKFMLKAGLETERVTRNTLIVDIMGAFYLVIYTRGLENASKMQLDLSETQLFRMQKMVETGREALSKQYELESQVSGDRLAYTIAKNNASQSLTSLRQMLQVDPGSGFDIMMPELNNILITDSSFRPDSIYYIASQVLPRLKAINFELSAAKKQIAATRGSLVPNLSAGGSLFTGYYILLNDTSAHTSFSKQMNDNFGQAIFLTLNIPIFNNYITGRNIKLAKIRKNDAELRLVQEKNTLYTEIENACLNYNRGKDEYAAAVANFDFNKKSFEGVQKKFEEGLIDVTGFGMAKNSLFKADTDALRTKLQMLIRRLTIKFYCTGDYENILNN